MFLPFRKLEEEKNVESSISLRKLSLFRCFLLLFCALFQLNLILWIFFSVIQSLELLIFNDYMLFLSMDVLELFNIFPIFGHFRLFLIFPL